MVESNVDRPSVSGTQFSNVDQSDDPVARVRYLDMMTQSHDYKRDAIAALDLKSGDQVLDVGCGTGDDVRLIAELVGSTGRVVGLDPSETMIAEARRRGEERPVEFRQGDIYHLPFNDNSFNATRADRVFQHLTDPVAGLAEMRRVTGPGGSVSVLDPDYETLVLDVPNRVLFRKIRNHYLDTNVGRYSGSQLYRLFHQAGLTEIRVAGGFPIITDYTLANQWVDLRLWGDEARTGGAISDEEHAEWLDTLQTLEQTGSFFFGMGGVGIIGTKP